MSPESLENEFPEQKTLKGNWVGKIFQQVFGFNFLQKTDSISRIVPKNRMSPLCSQSALFQLKIEGGQLGCLKKFRKVS